MYKILFICYGNICRSPMAEFVMKDLVAREGLTGEFEIASAATSDEETGNCVYPPVRDLLSKKGISVKGKQAITVTPSDGDYYDYLIIMDSLNKRMLSRIISPKNLSKVFLLSHFFNEERDIDDPWYTRNFEACYQDIFKGCKALFACFNKH